MAQRRMFALTIIDSDAFLDMPISAQSLYFHLGMRADDDGFINNVKTIMRMAGCKDDDIKLLIAKKFILDVGNGIVVIKHWNINNYIQKDRYTETKYKEQKALLSLDENKSYTLSNKDNLIECIQDVSKMETQVRLGKDSKDKVIYIKHIPDLHYVKLTQDKYDKLKVDFPNVDLDDVIVKLEEYVASTDNKNKYKDYNLVLRRAIKGNWFSGYKNNYSKKQDAPIPNWYSEMEERKQLERKKLEEKLIPMDKEELEQLAKGLFND